MPRAIMVDLEPTVIDSSKFQTLQGSNTRAVQLLVGARFTSWLHGVVSLSQVLTEFLRIFLAFVRLEAGITGLKIEKVVYVAKICTQTQQNKRLSFAAATLHSVFAFPDSGRTKI